MYNLGPAYGRNDAERLFRHLVVEGILAEELHITALDHAACYVKLGRKSQDVLAGTKKVNCLFMSYMPYLMLDPKLVMIRLD